MKISVIITAFNRKEYVTEAISSVTNQSLETSKYEIIVISNFKIILSNINPDVEIKCIVMNGTVGEFLYKGFKIAKNDIIAFLDDDDVWDRDRLKKILCTFSLYPNLGYYHNSTWFMDSLGKPIELLFRNPARVRKGNYFGKPINFKEISRLISVAAGFNLSSIAISKSAFVSSLETLRLITANTDGFFFWVSLINRAEVYIDKRELTGYRIHDQNRSIAKNQLENGEEFLRQMDTYILLLGLAKESFKDKVGETLYQHINLQYLELRVQLIMTSRKSKSELISCVIEMLVFMRITIDFYAFRILLYSLSYVVSPKLYSFVIKKVSYSGFNKA